MSGTRQASHAGSWYSSGTVKLNQQLEGWLAQVSTPSPNALDGGAPLEAVPVKGSRAIIAPHAGYSYSGPAAAWAYRCVDTDNIKRVFILGPSHHAYLDGCAITKCASYATPVGDLPIDLEATKTLEETGQFSKMDIGTDEDEHSIEMHLPYVRKIFEGKDIKIVPILVGAISTSKETSFGKLLAPYLSDPENFFVVSSDFCHWGSRFSYTYYKAPDASATSLSRSSQPSSSFPIHESITALDKRGMAAAALGGQAGRSAGEAHAAFAGYLKETKNTVCGRHPIGVLLAAAAALQDAGEKGWGEDELELSWTRYEHSSECEKVSDSSVSYASAYIRAGQ